MQTNQNKHERVIEVDSQDELPFISKELLKFVGDDKIILFSGEMGAGKTTLIKAICHELGVKEGMSSPTFSIVNEYQGANNQKIYHFDFYRIKEEREAIDVGIEEYFDSQCYCMIEWPEKIINLLPESWIRVTILNDHNKRLITFSHE